MNLRSVLTSEPLPAFEHDDLVRWMAEGGDDRLALDARTGRNAYGCHAGVWTGGLTFSSSTVSPLSPDGLAAAGAWLSDLLAGSGREPLIDAAAARVRRALTASLGLGAETGGEGDIVLAPSGTDLHAIAAACARAEGRGSLSVVACASAESGRLVDRALRGPADGDEPPAQVISVAVRLDTGAARPAEHIDGDVEAACHKAARAGGPMLLVVLDVSKTGLVAPSPACAARLKAEYGDRLTVLVDACQLREPFSGIREHLARGFLVAVTGSKFLGGPPFSGALLIPAGAVERLRSAPPACRALSGSFREDWPGAYAERALLPRATSLGPMLRWAAALDTLAEVAATPTARLAGVAGGFAAALAERIDARPETFARLDAASPVPGGGRSTIVSILVRRDGRALAAEAVAALHARLRDLAHRRGAGHLWLGQPVTVGRGPEGPLSAVRIALSARHLLAHAALPDGCGRLMALADASLREIERIVADQ